MSTGRSQTLLSLSHLPTLFPETRTIGPLLEGRDRTLLIRLWNPLRIEADDRSKFNGGSQRGARTTIFRRRSGRV